MTRKEFYSKYPMVSGADLDSLIDWVNAPKSEMAGVVLGKIADMCYVSVADIKDKSRLREIADARFLFCRYAKDELSMGFKDIGSMINRHHASVIHAVKESKKVPQLVKKYAEVVDYLKSNI